MLKNMRLVGRTMTLLGAMMFLVNLWGCGVEKTSAEKVRDVAFTVIDQSEIPQELQTSIEEKKKEGFKLTYSDEKNRYMAVGYGEQKTGGYSISVDECYLSTNALYFGTTLTGPEKGEKINEVSSYPYIVVRTELLEENVVFE